MAVITQTFTLNLVPNLSSTLVVHCSQADGGLKEFKVTMLNGTSIYTIPNGATVYIEGTCADGKIFNYKCSYADAVVTIPLQDDMTATAGPCVCDLLFLDSSNNRIGTANFILFVEEGIASGYEFNQYGDIIEAFSDYINAAVYYQNLSKSYAVGGTGARDGENEDNAKYYYTKIEELQELIDKLSEGAIVG